MTRRAGVALVPFIALLTVPRLGADPASKDVPSLIRELGHEDLARRKTAYDALKALDPLPPEIKEAAERSVDLEVRSACERLVLRFDREMRLEAVKDEVLRSRLRNLLDLDPTKCVLIGKGPPKTAWWISKVHLRLLPLPLKEQVIGLKRDPSVQKAEIALEAEPDKDGWFWFSVPPGAYFRSGHGMNTESTTTDRHPSPEWKVKGLEFEAKANDWVVLPEIK